MNKALQAIQTNFPYPVYIVEVHLSQYKSPTRIWKPSDKIAFVALGYGYVWGSDNLYTGSDGSYASIKPSINYCRNCKNWHIYTANCPKSNTNVKKYSDLSDFTLSKAFIL